MNIVVLLKNAYDPNRLKINKENNKPLLTKTPKKINDIDRNAIETALELREKYDGKVYGLCVGGADDQEVLIEAIAIGVDDVFLVDIEELEVTAFYKALLIGKAIEKIGIPDLVIAGEASVDNYTGQTGPRVAEVLNIPSVTLVDKILRYADEYLEVVKKTELGNVIYKLKLPALITVTREINVPRYISLLKIRRASSHPIRRFTVKELGVEVKEKIRRIDLQVISVERKNIVFKDDVDDSAKKLINKLKEEMII